MDELEVSASQARVTFHNVAQSFVPGTPVECRYTLGSHVRWASKDWIGLFKVGWSSIRDYYTFVWSPAPGGYTVGSTVNCCVRFQAFYLPGDGAVLYQFCYVDSGGESRGASPPFTFRCPEPGDELVMVEEVESSSDMLLVMTRTCLLETQLSKSEKAKENLAKKQKELEGEVQDLGARIQEMERAGRSDQRERARLVDQTKSLAEERQRAATECQSLRRQQADSAARIRVLEDDAGQVGRKLLEREAALDRASDRVKKLTVQLEQMSKQVQEEAEEKKLIQAQLETSKRESRALRGEQAERDGQLESLKGEVQRLGQKLGSASNAKAQYDAVSEQLRRARDQLSSSRQEASQLGQELAGASSARDRTMSELHRSRLQAAGLEAELAEVTGRWEEAKGQWLSERSVQLQISEVEKEKVLKLSTELLKWKAEAQEAESEAEGLRLELGRERDCSRVQLSEMLRERKELKSAVCVVQKENELLRSENREILEYVKRLERKLEQGAEFKQRENSSHREAAADSIGGVEQTADESGGRDGEIGGGRLGATPRVPRDDAARLAYGGTAAGEVVISQPVPIALQIAEGSRSQSGVEEPESWDHTARTTDPSHVVSEPEPARDSGVRYVTARTSEMTERPDRSTHRCSREQALNVSVCRLFDCGGSATDDLRSRNTTRPRALCKQEQEPRLFLFPTPP
ncbi:calcium-binding and coiled-coil domain-containing protein 1-like [Heptranchias perlo]|uniref:calcium-binding and coiled-coil domain-containing protein 1-like n=1 Tax=Heptranchias perlo TaxID=212740 RepID=UPI00355A790D